MRPILILIVCILLKINILHSQNTSLAKGVLSDSINSNNAEKYKLHITRTSEPITLDGQLTEKIWQTAEVAQSFWQQKPVDDKPASRRTEVRLAYDDRNIYVAAICYDSVPYFINTLKRDNYGQADDFAILLDPNGQKASGFGFAVNVMNAQTEVLLTDGDVNNTWDNRWSSAVNREVGRWTVEMMIPFKTLRFKEGIKNWGIQFLRDDPGANEEHVWAQVPRQFDNVDFGYFGTLIWDEAPKKQGSNIALIPYTTGSVRKEFSPEKPTSFKPNIGGDAKIALTSSLNLDLTTFPDFSQVEVDRQVTNLTRFSLFFPERRQFFVENSDIFTGFGTDFGGEQPFYSRTIGLSGTGQAVPILYGARLTGNINPSLRVGAFNMHARLKSTNVGQNFSATTFQQRIGKRSFFKGLFLNRQGFYGSEKIGRDYERNAGGEFEYSTPDGTWKGKFGMLNSIKQGLSGKNNHIYGGAAYSGQRFRTFIEIQNMGENYYSDMGFTGRLVQYDPSSGQNVRVGFTQFSNMMDYYTYPKASKTVNFHWSGLENFAYTNADGSLNEWYTRLRHFIFFKNTAQLRFRLNNNYVNLLYPFDITDVPLPAKAYNMTEFNIQFNTDTRKKTPLSMFIVYGQFYNGTKLTIRSEASLRAQPWGNFTLGIEKNNIWLPQPYGNVNLTLANARAEINFSTSLFWTTFLQYNTQANNFNVNSRLQWRFAPMSDLFLVYTDNYRVEGLFGPKDRTLTLKMNYWLSL
jgi:Domain of unknown function (DUF5916)/Carbohydrate family 9 binding domain-like